jgi:hypothetical protein
MCSMPPQPPAIVELPCKAMKSCLASVAAGCTTGMTSSLPLWAMPPAGRACPAHVILSMLSLTVIMMKQDMLHAKGDIYTILCLGHTRLLWTLWLPTLAALQVSPIMPTLSKVQQQQQPASRNATHPNGTAYGGSRSSLSPWRVMVTLTLKLWITFGTLLSQVQVLVL